MPRRHIQDAQETHPKRAAIALLRFSISRTQKASRSLLMAIFLDAQNSLLDRASIIIDTIDSPDRGDDNRTGPKDSIVTTIIGCPVAYRAVATIGLATPFGYVAHADLWQKCRSWNTRIQEIMFEPW